MPLVDDRTQRPPARSPRPAPPQARPNRRALESVDHVVHRRGTELAQQRTQSGLPDRSRLGSAQPAGDALDVTGYVPGGDDDQSAELSVRQIPAREHAPGLSGQPRPAL